MGLLWQHYCHGDFGWFISTNLWLCSSCIGNGNHWINSNSYDSYYKRDHIVIVMNVLSKLTAARD